MMPDDVKAQAREFREQSTAPRFRYNLPMPSADQPNAEPSSAVTPAVEAFIARWSPSGGGERTNYQLFLSELYDVLGAQAGIRRL
jgi:hypothetical protein